MVSRRRIGFASAFENKPARPVIVVDRDYQHEDEYEHEQEQEHGHGGGNLPPAGGDLLN